MMQGPSLSPLPLPGDVRLLLSDLHLAAFLLTKGARLLEVRLDETGRATLILRGEGILHHKRAYAAGEVCVNLPRLKEKHNLLRDLLSDFKKSHPMKGPHAPHTRSENRLP